MSTTARKYERAEHVGARGDVGLAVDLDQDAELAVVVNVAGDHPIAQGPLNLAEGSDGDGGHMWVLMCEV